MRKKMKRFVKRLLKTGSLLIFVGLGVLLGFTIGVDSAGSSEHIVIHSDYPNEFSGERAETIEHVIEERVEQQIGERIVIPPLPTVPPPPPMPALPEIPEIPDLPAVPEIPTTIHIERSPSFFEVVNGIGTILASLGLIGLGVVILVRNRRQPKEKTPGAL